jgi:sRNA-binding carbon storage regulator CsrA
MALVLGLQKGEIVKIGDDVFVMVGEKTTGSCIKLAIKAPEHVKITRVGSDQQTTRKVVHVFK